MVKRSSKNQTAMIVAAVAVIGVVIAIIGFHKSSKDKTQRAMWSGLSNTALPASMILSHLDLGNVGDDMRYTINRSSGIALGHHRSLSRERGDPNWLDLQFKADAMHGEHRFEKQGYTLEHTPVDTMITAPSEIIVKPIIVSNPKVGSNHETVAGTFLPFGGYPMDQYIGVIP